ncbi:MAG: hypothetical protein FWE21_02645 [Defluviitaleaceae bacterium]|nr:hypothetical protein [Defluviitaleaceae bacterium]
MENTNKKRFWQGKTAIAAGVLVFVLAVGSIGLYAAFSHLFGTALTINSSFENFGDEFMQRLETTPLISAVRAAEALQDGVITADVGVRQAGFFGINADVSARLYSNAENAQSAMFLDAGFFGMNFDLRAFADENSLAIGSDAFLGEGNFGVFFDSFREDAQNFAGLMDWTQGDLDDIAGLLDTLAGQMAMLNSVGAEEEHNFQPYIMLINDFINEIEQERLSTNINGVDAERITLEITNDDLISLLTRLYNVIAADEQLRFILDTADARTAQQMAEWDQWWYEWSGEPIVRQSSFEVLLEEVQWVIDDIVEAEYDILITMHFYIGNGNRLVRWHLNAAGAYDIFSMTLDTGAHALDTWTLETSSVTTWRGETREETILIEWALENTGITYENTITITTDGWWNDTPHMGTLSSVWTPETGAFTLGFADERDSGSFSGLFFLEDDSMNLQFEDIVIDDITITIQIGAEAGATVPQANFINISQWDQDLIDQVERQISTLMLTMSLLGTIW